MFINHILVDFKKAIDFYWSKEMRKNDPNIYIIYLLKI